jgi:hypothetical protein
MSKFLFITYLHCFKILTQIIPRNFNEVVRVPFFFITTSRLHATCGNVPSYTNMTGFDANRDKRIKTLYIYNTIGLV